MSRISLFVGVVLCLPVLSAAQTNEAIVPAGTLLQCTLDEPRFSSETAQVGDPLVCYLDSFGMFGRPVFPRGAYLSGRFEDFRDPGHFFGKGWLKLEFDSITLPGGTFPVAARIISIPHYRVDVEGRIRGNGHARRDAIGWFFPVLWPAKLITLPARGPRPVLKGETRVLLRVLEDVSIPGDAASGSSMLSLSRSHSSGNAGIDSQNSSSGKFADPLDLSVSTNGADRIFPKLRYGGASIPGAEIEPGSVSVSTEVHRAVVYDRNRLMERPWRAPRSTLLVCRDGRAYLVTNYWLEAGQLVYFASDNVRRTLPLEDLDLEMTAKVNRERGLAFVIRRNPAEH